MIYFAQMKAEHDRRHGGQPRMMRCAVCVRCWENPDQPGRCIYGGPFAGYVRVPESQAMARSQ